MTNKLQHTDISLKDLVSNIEKGYYTIPKFQRDFVWKSTDVSSLADSIIRGYPIASLLTIPYDSNLKVGATPLRTNGSHVSSDYSKLDYILDGQQRITSIAKIFLNYDNDKNYYFDLLLLLKDTFPEDVITMKEGKKLKDTEFLCRYFQKKVSGEEEPTRHYFRYISGKTILDSQFSYVVNKFLSNLENLTDENYVKYLNFLNAQLGAISGYGIPLTAISQDADLGLICRVFEKVNSTGIKLTTFDLINAKSFDTDNINYKIGLSNYISNQLLNYNKAFELNKVYNDFLDYDENSNQFLNIARIIRIIFLAESFAKNKTPNISNHQMLSKNSDYWFNQWEFYKENILRFLHWLADEEITKLAPNSFYEYVGAMLICRPKLFDTNCFMRFLKRKALSLGITGSTFTKSNFEDISEIFDASQKVLNASELDKHKVIPKLNIHISEDELGKRFNKGTLPYNVCIYIMSQEKMGKFNVDLLNFPIKKNNFDEHHIIPKQQSKGKDGLYNTIINITLLNSDSNRNEIKGKPLLDYLETIKKLTNSEEKFINICEQNLIPIDYIDDSELFLEARKEIMTNYLNGYFI